MFRQDGKAVDTCRVGAPVDADGSDGLVGVVDDERPREPPGEGLELGGLDVGGEVERLCQA